MIRIHKIVSQPTIDYAAEELKKYLRMMMPRCGEIRIDYAPGAGDGFRLGLMQDFGLDVSDAEDPKQDDIVYFDCDGEGGIIAGSNPCALLIAVYRYLRACGCRWLFPGTDGEWIPIIEGLPKAFCRHLADHRYRGQCNEGAEFQPNMMESIEFAPKIGMNTYMLEFDVPMNYYNKYYNHTHNTFRRSMTLNNTTVLQWKRQCEAEIQKRGMHFHDMGHGWTAEPFGIDSSKGWVKEAPGSVPEEKRRHIALLNGEREYYHGIPLNTNVCMSNPETRRIMVNYIADYAEKQNNVDFLHIWLADGKNNHCECEVCRKKTTSDWYIILLNEIDEELTRRKLDTHLVFIAYTETFWPPESEKFRNTKRFTMLYAPIYRLYTESYREKPDISAVTPYKRNHNVPPKGIAASLGYLQAWKKTWAGDCFCYEYHFWKHQVMDLSGMRIAKVLYDDVHGLRQNGLSGIVEDGSQRSFFPTGFAFYVYAESLYDVSVSYDALKEDYFSHAFGADWKKVVAYLEAIRDAIPFAYMEGLMRIDPEKSAYFNPEVAMLAAKAGPLTDAFLPIIEKNRTQPTLASMRAWEILEFAAKFFRAWGDLVARIADGRKENVLRDALAFRDLTSREEVYLERWYDHYLYWMYLLRTFPAELAKEAGVEIPVK